MPDQWRIVFMGTPDFACSSLSALASSEDQVLAVVTQPDRPKGRGRKLAPPPIKVLAQKLGLEIWQPETVRHPDIITRLETLSPDLLVVVAFGQILSGKLLDLPRLAPLNVHASLLPAYRGPAPINWAIINGESQTGVTTMFMDRGVDTGPILLIRKTNIGEIETAGSLHDRLSKLGAELLIETIAGLKASTVSSRSQPKEGISHAPLLRMSDGLLDWNRSAIELARLVRGLDPWPGAHTSFKDRRLKLYGGRVGEIQGQPGRILGLENGWLHIATSQGSLMIAEMQLAGHKRLTAPEFWHGQRLSTATVFGI